MFKQNTLLTRVLPLNPGQKTTGQKTTGQKTTKNVNAGQKTTRTKDHQAGFSTEKS